LNLEIRSTLWLGRAGEERAAGLTFYCDIAKKAWAAVLIDHSALPPNPINSGFL
jgi:hypothetical protein